MVWLLPKERKVKLESNDLPSVAQNLLRIFKTVAYDKHYEAGVKMSNERAIIKVDECSLHLDKPEMCLAHTTMEKTVVEELNPLLIYRIGKFLAAGDAYCEHIIEFKH